MGTAASAGVIASGRRPNTAIEVWLAIGDSEMRGWHGADAAPAGLIPTDGSVLTWNWATSAFVNAAENSGINSSDKGLLPAFFGTYRQQRVGGVVAVVNAAYGGVLSSDWLSGSSVIPSGLTTNLYTNAINAIGLALAVPNTLFAGFIDWNGANDATLGSPNWNTNMTTVMASLRASIAGASTKKRVYAQLPNLTPGLPACVAQWPTVRTQQAAHATSLDVMVEVDRWINWGGSTDYGIHPLALGSQVVAWQMDRRIAGLADSWPTTAPSAMRGYANRIDPQTANLHFATGSDVDSLTDVASGLAYTQTTSSARPAQVATDSAFNNQPVLNFVDDSLTNTNTTALAHLHNGLGGTFSIVFDDNASSYDGLILSTAPGGGGNGIWIRRTSNQFQVFIWRGGGAVYYQIFQALTIPQGKTILWFRFKTGALQIRIGESWNWSDGVFIGGAANTGAHGAIAFGGSSGLNAQISLADFTSWAAYLTDFEIYQMCGDYRTRFAVSV
jgi:hypothetical protein